MEIDIKKLSDLIEEGLKKLSVNLTPEIWNQQIKPITQPFLEAINEKLFEEFSKNEDKGLMEFFQPKGKNILNISQYKGTAKKMPDGIHRASKKIPIYLKEKLNKNGDLDVNVQICSPNIVGEENYLNSICWGIESWGSKKHADFLSKALSEIVIDDWSIDVAKTETMPSFSNAWCFKSINSKELIQFAAEDIVQQISDDLIALVRDIKNNKDMLESFVSEKLKIKSESLSNERQVLDLKKQIILYGPPGTGKTFNTRNIAIDLIDR